MMKLKIYMLLCAYFIAAACQKRKYPDEKVNLDTENIYFNGTVGNEPVFLKIGSDGYYCYSSYKQGADSTYLFEGELRKFDCSPCPRSLRVQLSDYRTRQPGASVPVDSVFAIGSRNFIPSSPKTKMVRLTAFSNKEVSSIRWDLSNGTTSTDSIFNYEFMQAGPQTVSLTLRTKGDCESIVVNKIFIGGESNFFACSISDNPLPGNSSEFSALPIGGKAPFRYTWYFGDGGSSNLAAPSHSYQLAGSYPVKLLIEDAENHICESNYIHVTSTDKSSCSANMSLLYIGSRNVLFNGVIVQWTDQSNVALRSDNVDQPVDSYFQIIDSQEFAPNERGEKGRLLTLRFNLLLSDGNKKTWFKSENATIAVSYK